LFVIDSQDEQAPHAGSKVLRLGELTPAQLMEEFAALRGSDNDMTLRWMGPQFFMHRMSNLLAIGASDTAESLDLRLQDRNGDVQQFTVAAGDYPMIRKLRASPVASGPVPLYLQNVDRNFWLTALEGARTLYFQFNQVRDSEQKRLAEFSAQLGQELKAGDIAYLVIDVRHNNGGNNRLLRPLLQQLIAFEQASADNRIFVITGRNTFSAAQNFINRLERWTDAVFVGEPSASSPNFVGEETPFTLPWSRVMGSLSDLYWQDSDPWDQRQWIAMDIPVPVTAADYFANRDAALEAVLAEIDSLASQAD
jgi:C-terminal processing protease CtpA/Prc